jgi:serine protease Do
MKEQWERYLEKRQEESRKESGRRKPPAPSGNASGVILRDDGYILTNYHVVEDAEQISVKLSDGREFKADLTGLDEKSDIAVIRLKQPPKDLKVAKFADSAAVRVGEFAIAIGAPFDLEHSFTFGHVSAKGRRDVLPSWMGASGSFDQDFIQTDANINVGNSGGPLVNINGEVMGVNSMIRTSMGVGVGIGFAIPSNLAREIGDRLIEDGRFIRSWLGIGIADLREYRRFRDIDTQAKDGVVVRSIEPNGPAYGSDLKPADVITSVDGKAVATTQQLRSLISRKKAGSEVVLDVFRRDEKMRIKVKPDEKPTREMLASNRKPKSSKEPAGVMELGMTVKPLTKELAKQFEVDVTGGVIVTEVQSGSLASRYEIKPGDIITDINHEPVRSPKEFQTEVSKAKGRVLVSFIRDGTPQFEVLKERSK